MDDHIRNRWYLSFGGSLNVLIGLVFWIQSDKAALLAWGFILAGAVMKLAAFIDAINQGRRRGE